MKKFISRAAVLLMVILLLVSSLAVGLYAAPAVEGRKTCTAYIADIEVDGKIDDAWAYAPVIEVTNVKQNASAWYGDNSKEAGRDYATLNCKVLWNGEDTLYVLYEVYDKLISMEGEFPWTCDSFELFLQMDNEAKDSSGAMIHYQTYADGNNTLGLDVGYDWHDNNHVYEIAVDVSAVTDGNYIGIDFQYNDDAEGKGERNICLGWSDTVDKASSDVTVYGQCELSTTTAAYLAAAAAEIEAPAATTPAAPATADMGIIAACALLALSAGAVMAAKKR